MPIDKDNMLALCSSVEKELREKLLNRLLEAKLRENDSKLFSLCAHVRALEDELAPFQRQEELWNA